MCPEALLPSAGKAPHGTHADQACQPHALCNSTHMLLCRPASQPAGSFDREQDGEGWEVVGDPSAYKDRWGAWVHARDLRRRRTVQLAPPPQGPAPIQAGGGQFDALAALLDADGFAVQDLQAMLLQQQAADAAGGQAGLQPPAHAGGWWVGVEEQLVSIGW